MLRIPLKISTCLLLLLVSSGFAGGQQSLDALFSVHADSLPLREVMDIIEQETGRSFSYSSRLFNDQLPVTLHLDRASLDQVLSALFKGMELRYEVAEKQIIMKRSRQPMTIEVVSRSQPIADPTTGKFTLSGFVKDALSGEVLVGATVSFAGGTRGSITNQYGFYSITLKEHLEELICTYVGYKRTIVMVRKAEDQIIHFEMEREVARLSEVTISSTDAASILRTTGSSEGQIRPESVRRMPALLGEKDVIKSLESIPGITFFGDGSTIFYVRGGGRDQNLITIDEAPVYNPTHLLGFFSTVAPDAIKEVKVYKGDFPAQYGGRLSSLIDIRTKDGNMNRFGFDGSVGLISSRLSLEGPLWKEHISFFVSGRRSYITPILRQFDPQLGDLHFSDLHLKLNYHINPKNRVFFSLYRGTDNYEQLHSGSPTTGINWQNSTTTLRWNHLFSDRLFSNLTLLGSRYDYFLNTNLEAKDYWNSHIDNLTLKYDFTWYFTPVYTLRFGVLSAAHFHNPGNYYRGGEEFDPGLDLSTKKAREYVLYASNQFILNENISIRAGLRLTFWQNVGPATEYDIVTTTDGDFERDSLAVIEHFPDQVYHQYASLDPRISLVYQPAGIHTLKGSYSRTSQYQFMITNSISPFTSLEVWLPAGPNVPPQVAHQFTLGYTLRPGTRGLKLDIEGYYKLMGNLIDYRDHAHMLLNPLVEYELRFGNGRGYGVEAILSKEEGRLSGWVSYTLSRAEYEIGEINRGRPYPAYSDRPHDLSVYITWLLHPRITLTGNFTYMTGAPFTTPTSFYFYDNHQVPVYGERNNDRLPPYHRLDLALNWQLNRPGNRFQHELIFSVTNLYNRKNPVALHFNKIEDANGNFVIPSDYFSQQDLATTHFYLYGAVPSISYHFYF
jgi:hypothetical protein